MITARQVNCKVALRIFYYINTPSSKEIRGVGRIRPLENSHEGEKRTFSCQYKKLGYR